MIDFKLVDTSNKIASGDYYEIEMDSTCQEELPVVTSDMDFIYAQSIAIMATINKGQLPNHESTGITPYYKRFSQSPDKAGRIFQVKVIEELSSMISTMFQNNTELLEYAVTQNSTIQMTPDYLYQSNS